MGKAKKAITLPEDHERLLVRSVGMLIIAGDEQDVRAEMELVTYFSQAIFEEKIAIFGTSKRFFHQILLILAFFSSTVKQERRERPLGLKDITFASVTVGHGVFDGSRGGGKHVIITTTYSTTSKSHQNLAKSPLLVEIYVERAKEFLSKFVSNHQQRHS